MTLGVDDIARIPYEAIRLGLRTGEMPWKRMKTNQKDVLRIKAQDCLNNPEPNTDDTKLRMFYAFVQQLRKYM